MKQFKNILLIAPFDNQLMEQGTALANTHQSKLTLMAIAPTVDEAVIETSSGKKIDIQKLVTKDVKSDLNEHVAKLKNRDFRVQSKVASGQPFIEIIRQVEAKKHDLVIMLADGVSSIREQLFGTLSLHLMRKCPCPVWIVKPSRRRKLRNVFAAVDPDPTDETRHKLNSEIIQRASTLAQNANARLHVVHAWNTVGSDASRSRRWMTNAEVRLYIDQVATEHRRRLKELLDENLDGKEVVHMLQGSPGVVIPEVVTREKADLLVMGTVCRTGVPGFFIGNTAEMILSQVDCSVLTVKPDGFESPVKFT